MSNLRTIEEMLAYAEACDLEVIYPKPNEIFIDIDTLADFKFFEDSMFLVYNEYPFSNYKVFQSKTEGHFHIYLQLAKNKEDYYTITSLERTLIQACLGSDRNRELLTFFRIKNSKDTNPTVFFKPKNESYYKELTKWQQTELYRGKLPIFKEKLGEELSF